VLYLAAQAVRQTWLLRGPPARCLPRAGGPYHAAATARGLPSRSAWCRVR